MVVCMRPILLNNQFLISVIRHRREKIYQLIISISKDKTKGQKIRLPFLKISDPRITLPYMEVIVDKLEYDIKILEMC